MHRALDVPVGTAGGRETGKLADPAGPGTPTMAAGRGLTATRSVHSARCRYLCVNAHIQWAHRRMRPDCEIAPQKPD
jgi:hypothetical protein